MINKYTKSFLGRFEQYNKGEYIKLEDLRYLREDCLEELEDRHNERLLTRKEHYSLRLGALFYLFITTLALYLGKVL